ncbi:hypothetical protein WL01_15375 [Burkholderia ubonensis]|nr:hypothetical protein WJ81_09535 [Burkholderia ubonensis]KVX17503.1 hypothetical protein WL01_15375 [Burkholderia ubonensis]KVX82871.1 hypothetical protein WL09_23305 [Burkholderia ubonensis]KVZ54579.1 hypothetical protein WL20_28010 [Burkholderia ubonensis]KVZ60516.1 hypothetical protein WL21_28155 [Burkholderia ubonensis]
MRVRRIVCVLAAACLAMPLGSMAAYKAGAHQWDVKGGRLVVMSGVMSDHAVEAYFNYTFYFDSAVDKKLYQVPILKGRAQQKFDLTIIGSGDGEISAQDVKVVTSRDSTYLLVGEKGGDNAPYGAGPVDVRVYKLVEGNDGDWAYYFQPIRTDRYPMKKNYTVEQAIAESEKRIASGE